jgi:hypothetical protein
MMLQRSLGVCWATQQTARNETKSSEKLVFIPPTSLRERRIAEMATEWAINQSEVPQ